MTRGLSEDAAESSLHRVINRLSEVASASSSTATAALAAAAARCLGEIGPCDLRTLVLQPGAAVRARPKNPFRDYAGHIAEVKHIY